MTEQEVITKKIDLDNIIQGDALTVLKSLPSNSIDTVLTSPPYWGLRDYGEETKTIWGGNSSCEHEWGDIIPSRGHTNWYTLIDKSGHPKKPDRHENPTHGQFCSACGVWFGSLGLEPTFQLYLDHLTQIFHEVKRVLKPTGTLWVNLGATYSGISGGLDNSRIKYSGWAHGNKTEGLGVPDKNPSKIGVPAKSLCLIPERLALRLVDDGWTLRNRIVWHKPNHMPSSVKDRFANSWEYMYFFSKSRKYWFSLNAVRVPHSISTIQRITQPTVFEQQGGIKQDLLRGKPEHGNASRSNMMVQSLARKYQGKFNMRVRLATRKKGGLEAYPNVKVAEWEKEAYDSSGVKKEGYQGKFSGMGEDSEKFNSPRARTQRLSSNLVKDNLPIPKGTIVEWQGKEYKIREGRHTFKRSKVFGNLDGQSIQVGFNNRLNLEDLRGKNPGDLWTINTQPFKGSHFAVFPEKLCERPIRAGCPPKGLVLDPFAGAGTALVVAKKLGRHYLGIELKGDYIKMAEKRLAETSWPLDWYDGNDELEAER